MSSNDILTMFLLSLVYITCVSPAGIPKYFLTVLFAVLLTYSFVPSKLLTIIFFLLLLCLIFSFFVPFSPFSPPAAYAYSWMFSCHRIFCLVILHFLANMLPFHPKTPWFRLYSFSSFKSRSRRRCCSLVSVSLQIVASFPFSHRFIRLVLCLFRPC